MMAMKFKPDISSITKRLGYGDRIRPARDWFLLLSVAFVLAIASIAWNAWLLVKVERGETLDASAAPALFDAAPIESVRALFENRAEEARKFKQEYRFVDPSR